MSLIEDTKGREDKSWHDQVWKRPIIYWLIPACRSIQAYRQVHPLQLLKTQSHGQPSLRHSQAGEATPTKHH
ncbi:hypothetical protein SNE40_010479 [Patella caerulea]|uniref:Uncharacterized protein n=1 Tax=Patella caerulea TaxID=87958 RepID=A0AAN8JY15_PATCE